MYTCIHTPTNINTCVYIYIIDTYPVIYLTLHTTEDACFVDDFTF